MIIRYAVKNAFDERYLAEAKEVDKLYHPKRTYAFHVCNAIYEVALFNTKKDAIRAYSDSFSNPLNETGVIVEMIVNE